MSPNASVTVSKTPLERFGRYRRYHTIQNLTLKVANIHDFALELIVLNVRRALTHLTIENTSHVFTNYLSLSHLHLLTSITFRNIAIGEDIAPLRRLVLLEAIEISNTDITDGIITDLFRGTFPRLHSVNIDNNRNVTDTSLLAMCNHITITDISFQSCSGITSAGIEHMCKHLSHLRVLNMSGIPDTSNSNIELPSTLTNLYSRGCSIMWNDTVSPSLLSLVRSNSFILLDIDHTNISRACLTTIVGETKHRVTPITISIRKCPDIDADTFQTLSREKQVVFIKDTLLVNVMQQFLRRASQAKKVIKL